MKTAQTRAQLAGFASVGQDFFFFLTVAVSRCRFVREDARGWKRCSFSNSLAASEGQTVTNNQLSATRVPCFNQPSVLHHFRGLKDDQLKVL